MRTVIGTSNRLNPVANALNHPPPPRTSPSPLPQCLGPKSTAAVATHQFWKEKFISFTDPTAAKVRDALDRSSDLPLPQPGMHSSIRQEVSQRGALYTSVVPHLTRGPSEALPAAGVPPLPTPHALTDRPFSVTTRFGRTREMCPDTTWLTRGEQHNNADHFCAPRGLDTSWQHQQRERTNGVDRYRILKRMQNDERVRAAYANEDNIRAVHDRARCEAKGRQAKAYNEKFSA